MGRRAARVRGAAIGIATAAVVVATTACAGQSETSAAGQPGEAPVRTVEHARGITQVPADPQRVVVLEPVHLDTAVALDVVPVGAAVLSEATGVPAYLGDKADGVEVVGTVPEPNVEEIASLQPDLIIGTETRHAALYERFAAIAPTVYMASQADPWQDNVRLVATALNKTERAESLLDDYRARCEQVATEHGTEGRTAQLIRPRDGILTLYGPSSFAGSTLECAGFTIPPRDWENSISIDLSPERAAEAQADLVVVTSLNPADPTTMPPALTNNVGSFPDLHLVDMSYWITGVGPLGGMTVLDDIDRILDATPS
ncbi:ABC transporter substrate-binding protein [Rhodococcus rhodochrous]|uniref:Iron ABC transporter substrate-binding protein n=1 Tax=Rhodococcus rhodochrous KG-21 TaxID=1441923 RepID=A0A0N0S0P2_RHORH|nr:iron-siderophore ABC transporter substrate-binding protein [Rhodococcus rhodochrous]KOS54877.1 iron ABC transporter substrate-binding protein [Rhodococcus rhodochrous KG-21]